MSYYHMIVQARRESVRLEDKVLKEMNGQAMILWQLDRLSECRNIDNLVIATTNSKKNQLLQSKLKNHGYSAFACPVSLSEDVLKRYTECFHWIIAQLGLLKTVEEHCIVRVTGDCPIIDPQVIDDIILYFEEGNLDYCALSQHWPDGLDVEVFKAQLLIDTNYQAKDQYEREHVTPYIWMNAQEIGWRLDTYPCPFDLSDHNWSVDDDDDFWFIEQCQEITMRRYGIHYGWRDFYNTLRLNLSWIRAATRKPRNEAFMKQIGVDGEWSDFRYEKDNSNAVSDVSEC